MRVPAILKPSESYPPWSWGEINDLIEEVGAFSKHELWLEMTERYTQSIAAKKHERITNKLSNTMPKGKYEQIPAEIRDAQDFMHDITNESAQVCQHIMGIVNDHRSTKKYIETHPMESIDETEELTTTCFGHIPPAERTKELHVISKIAQYGCLLMSDEILPNFHQRLRQILSDYEDYRYCHNERHRPTFSSLVLSDKEAEDAMKLCQRSLGLESKQLKEFLVDCLFNEYVPQDRNSMRGKSQPWMQYSIYLYWQGRSGENRDARLDDLAAQCGCNRKELRDFLGERLNMTIRVCKQDEEYVKDRIEEYYDDEYIGRWQRYVLQHRWEDLARKLHDDRRRLDELVEGEIKMPKEGDKMTLGCQIATNMRLVRSKYFKRLDGPRDFELSKTVLSAVRKKAEAEAKLEKAEKKKAGKATQKAEEIAGLSTKKSEPLLRSGFLKGIIGKRRYSSYP